MPSCARRAGAWTGGAGWSVGFPGTARGTSPLPCARGTSRDGATGSRDMAGAARALLTVDGSVDSLGLEARVSGERFKWRGWEVPAGRARFAYRPGSPEPSGPKPAFELEVRLDSLAHGSLGF